VVGRLKENKCSVSFYAQDTRAGFQVADVSLQKSVKTYITVRNGARYVCRTFVTYRARRSL